MASRSTGPDRSTVLAFAGVSLFGGLNTIAVKQTVAELAPLWGMGLRFLVAGLIFFGLAIVGRRSLPTGRGLLGAMLYGTVGFAAAFGFIYPALRQVPAGTAAVVIALAPLATYVLAVAQRQEHFQVGSLAGGLIALGGVAIVFVDQLGAAVPLASLAMVLVGMACLAEAGIIAKWIPRSDPFATNAVAMTTAGLLGIAASLLGGEAQVVPHLTATWLAIGYIVVLGSVAMFGLYLFGLARWSASGMSYSTLLLPFVSVTVATLVTGERFSLSFVAGGLVMLAGVYLGAFRVRRPSRSTATSMSECLPVDDCPEATAGMGQLATPSDAR